MDTVPAFAVFVLLPDTVTGRMDQAVKEFEDAAAMLAAVTDLVNAEQTWRAITIIRGEDVPRMLEGGYPTPPPAT